MEAIILDEIIWRPDAAALRRELHLADESPAAAEFAGLLDAAQAVARPKAAYGAAAITQHDAEGVVVDGVRLQSRVVSVNLRGIERVFPYLATCGQRAGMPGPIRRPISSTNSGPRPSKSRPSPPPNRPCITT
jgi:hypothetical protein